MDKKTFRLIMFVLVSLIVSLMVRAEEPKKEVVAGNIQADEQKDVPSGAKGIEGLSNTFYGQGAGLSTTATGNAFFGYQAGYITTSGRENTFLGHQAGYSNTTGAANIFLGAGAGFNNTTGLTNIFIGRGAGKSNTSGGFNIFLGSNAGVANTTAGFNIFLGYKAGYRNTTASNNIFIGADAGFMNTTGSSNIFFGLKAGYKNVTGRENIILGYLAGYNITAGASNTFLGYKAGFSNTTANNNLFIGYNSGYSNTTANNNLFIGYNAGYKNTTGNFNTFLGYQAGYKNFTANHNTFLGYQAGYNNTTGNYNTFLGDNAGQYATTANHNTFIGSQAGQSNTEGESNVFLGANAGSSNTTGHFNTFLGQNTGFSNSTGYRNTFIGYLAGQNNGTGYHNTFLGTGAGHENISGHRNVFLGNFAGYYERGSDKLYIDNSNTSSPLIYGEFDNKYIRINGNFDVTGYLSLDAGVTQISSTELNLLNGKTGVATGSADNDQLVTKGYVDDKSGLGIASLTDQFIGKWDVGSTRLVDSLISESAGVISINGKLGVGTTTPATPVHVLTPGGTTAKIWLETTGGSKLQVTGAPTSGQFGTVSNHQLRLVTNATWKMVIEPDGKVGIGILNPTYLLHLSGGAYSDGNTWTPASSRELKENISPLTGAEAIQAFEKLCPVKFNYKKNKTEDYIGFIAEDVPGLLATRDRKGVNTMDVVALLTKVVQEQQKVIKELRVRVARLEKR
jgi:hypothetical protein